MKDFPVFLHNSYICSRKNVQKSLDFGFLFCYNEIATEWDVTRTLPNRHLQYTVVATHEKQKNARKRSIFEVYDKKIRPATKVYLSCHKK